MIPAGPLFHKPKSIIAARNILYTALFLEALVFIFQQVIRDTPAHADIRVVFSNGIMLVLMYIAIRYIGFGKKWARILFSGTFCYDCSRFGDFCASSFQNKPCIGLSIHSPDAFAGSRTCFSVQ